MEVLIETVITLRVVCRILVTMPTVVLAIVQLVLKPNWYKFAILVLAILSELLLRRLGLFQVSVSNFVGLARTFQQSASSSTSWLLQKVDTKSVVYPNAQKELQRKRRFISSDHGLLILSISNGFGGKLASYRVLYGDDLVSVVLCPYKEQEILRKPMIQLLLNHEAGHTDMMINIWSIAEQVYRKSRLFFFVLIIANLPSHITYKVGIFILLLIFEWMWRQLPSSKFGRVLDEISADNFALRHCSNPEAVKRYKAWILTKSVKPQPWDDELSMEHNTSRRDALLQQIDLWERNELHEGLLNEVVNPHFNQAIILLILEVIISLLVNLSLNVTFLLFAFFIAFTLILLTINGVRNSMLRAIVEKEIQTRMTP
jgi:hypothetical protein